MTTLGRIQNTRKVPVETIIKDRLKSLSRRIARSIMTPGGSRKPASRMVLMNEGGDAISGWARKPLESHIHQMMIRGLKNPF